MRVIMIMYHVKTFEDLKENTEEKTTNITKHLPFYIFWGKKKVCRVRGSRDILRGEKKGKMNICPNSIMKYCQ